MARNFKEVAHTRTNMKNFGPNYDSIDWSSVNKKKEEPVLNPDHNPREKFQMDLVKFSKTMNDMSRYVHETNVAAGWWTDTERMKRIEALKSMGFEEATITSIFEAMGLPTEGKKKRNIGELLCLVHSEISEAMEGARKNLMDDKLPHRKMLEVELADAQIRIWDIAGSENLDLGGAIVEKMAYNAQRADHKLENRMKDGGKSF